MIKLNLSKNILTDTMRSGDVSMLKAHVNSMKSGAKGTKILYGDFAYTVDTLDAYTVGQVFQDELSELEVIIYANCKREELSGESDFAPLPLFYCKSSPLGGFDYKKMQANNCEIKVVENDGSESLSREEVALLKA